MPINGLAHIAFSGLLPSGQAWVNTFYVVNENETSPPTIAHLQGLADDLAPVFTTPYQGNLVSGASFTLIRATQVRDPKITPAEVVLQAQHPLSVSGVRTASTNFSPQPACALINFRTAVASRRFRSWMFLPPAMDSGSLLGDNFQTTNAYWTSCVTLNSAYTTGTSIAATRWTGTTLTNYSLCCYSKRAELLSTDSVALILSTSLSKRVRWLRSRQRGTS